MEVEKEVPLFGLWWLWIFSGCVYILIDALLFRHIVPELLKLFYKSKYFKRHNPNVLPGHTEAVITERILIAGTAVVIAIIGIIIIYQTSYDVIKARSGLLLPSAYVASCGFIHDLYRMFRRFKLSRIHYRDESNILLAYKMIHYQLSFVLHHVLLFTFGIIIAHPIMRRGLGDFLIGCLYLMEFTNPFVSIHFILKELMLEDSHVYKINGLITIGIHFITRILMVPFVYYIYAYQYHHSNILAAVQEMRLICHVTCIVGFMFQLYWFIRMIKLFITGAKNVLAKK